MYKLEITLSDDLATQLKALAEKLDVSVEALVASSVEEKVERHASFQEAARNVLDKNTELYKRLA
jgi:predicted transcriptional regulator